MNATLFLPLLAGVIAGQLFGQSLQYVVPHVTFQDCQWETELNLHNPSLMSQPVLITLFNHMGVVQAKREWLIAPSGLLAGRLDDLFSEAVCRSGWLLIETPGTPLSGSVQIRAPAGGIARLPLSTFGNRTLCLPLTSVQEAGLTGFVTVNPSLKANQVQFEMLDAFGNRTALKRVVLLPRAKFVVSVKSFFNQEAWAGSAVIRIHAEAPVAALGLAFTNGGAQLTVQPAQPSLTGGRDGGLQEAVHGLLKETLTGDRELPAIFIALHAPAAGLNLRAAAMGYELEEHPLALDYPLRLAGAGEMLTAALCLILQEEGLLHLEDRLGDYLDKTDLQGLHVFQSRGSSAQLTLRQLLNHITGFADSGGKMQRESGTAIKPCMSVKQACGAADPQELLVFTCENTDALTPPDQEPRYCDQATVLLRRVIEIVGGQSYAQLFQNYITHPLQMDATWQTGCEATSARFPASAGAETVLDGFRDTRCCAGYVSNLDDMAIFMSALFEGRVFNEQASLDQMLRFVNAPDGDGRLAFGLGVVLRFIPNVGHFIGRQGHSGAFLYYWVERGVTLAGSSFYAKFDHPGFLARLGQLLNGSWQQASSDEDRQTGSLAKEPLLP